MTRERQSAASPLADGDPSPVETINPAGASSFLLLGDHAGNSVPARLETLGVAPMELSRHIGWDIGVGTLGAMLAGALDAVFVRQIYSRLVIDCNRDPSAEDAIAAISDGTVVPGNAGLSQAARDQRRAAIHAPYHAAIAAELARRDAAGQATIIVSLHSFTPVMGGVARPWEIGVLYEGGDTDFARAVLEELRAEPGLTVGDNQPYRMDSTDYTVPLHAFAARRPYVELEIRQDQLGSDAGCASWCERLRRILPASLPIQDRMLI